MSVGPLINAYFSAWQKFKRAHAVLFKRALKGEATLPATEQVASAAAEMLTWVNISAAGRLRWKAVREPVKVPSLRIAQLEDVNPWLKSHMLSTDPLVRRRAVWLAQAERTYLESVKLTNPEKAVPDFRAERIRRDTVGEIANVSEQVQLSVPEIGDQFPFAVYHTRDDRRVRPTHAAMDGFIAARSWRGWEKVRPKCGYNCRCYLVFVSWHEAVKRGWIKNDKLQFETKWPNSAAKRNFNMGVFPDKNWQGPKYWAAHGVLV